MKIRTFSILSRALTVWSISPCYTKIAFLHILKSVTSTRNFENASPRQRATYFQPLKMRHFAKKASHRQKTVTSPKKCHIAKKASHRQKSVTSPKKRHIVKIASHRQQCVTSPRKSENPWCGEVTPTQFFRYPKIFRNFGENLKFGANF